MIAPPTCSYTATQRSNAVTSAPRSSPGPSACACGPSARSARHRLQRHSSARRPLAGTAHEGVANSYLRRGHHLWIARNDDLRHGVASGLIHLDGDAGVVLPDASDGCTSSAHEPSDEIPRCWDHSHGSSGSIRLRNRWHRSKSRNLLSLCGRFHRCLQTAKARGGLPPFPFPLLPLPLSLGA